MKVIMFVDDEKLILRGLQRIFIDGEHKYIYMNSGQDALDYLEEHHVDLICSDITMPGMDGFELLRIMKKAYPQTTRIALSSFNSNQVRRLVEENLAQFYIFKPWKNNELIQNIHKVLNMQRALYTRDMLKMVNNIDKLPTLPSIYNELTEMIIKECDVQKISQLIERDPTISASVLKVANSAYYGRRTGTLANAIMNIGLQDLKHIVITHAVLDLVSEDEVTFKRLWKQASLSNNILTGFYLEVLKKPVPELYASAGLLHNIGRLIFVANEIDYKGLVESSRSEQEICQLEKETFGICHQDLGGFLLNNWDLPFGYVEAAMYHHRPSDFRIINRELVSVVHIAHHFTEVLTGKKNHVINPVVFELLSVKEKDVNEFIESVKEKL